MKKYTVVLADPCWRFADKLRMSKTKRGAAAHYKTLTTRQIAAIPVRRWASKNSVLVLWVPASMIARGMRVMKAWGFEQRTVIVWLKQTKRGKRMFGMGRHFRGSVELALFGIRGHMQTYDRGIRQLLSYGFASPFYPGEHSRKPDDLHEILPRMYPDGRYLELFARRHVDGWRCCGLELEPSIDLTKQDPDGEFYRENQGVR